MLSHDLTQLIRTKAVTHPGYPRDQAQWIVDGVLGLAEQDAAPEIVRFVCQQLRR